jgi:hypothetical protein
MPDFACHSSAMPFIRRNIQRTKPSLLISFQFGLFADRAAILSGLLNPEYQAIPFSETSVNFYLSTSR